MKKNPPPINKVGFAIYKCEKGTGKPESKKRETIWGGAYLDSGFEDTTILYAYLKKAHGAGTYRIEAVDSTGKRIARIPSYTVREPEKYRVEDVYMEMDPDVPGMPKKGGGVYTHDQLADIQKHLLNLYPTKAAAECHAKLLPIMTYNPVKVTLLMHGVRKHLWALLGCDEKVDDLGKELAKAWRLTFVMGRHLPRAL